MTPDITNSENTPPPVAEAVAPPQPVLGYCRGCGVALTSETVRYAMGTMYCGEHLPAGAGSPNPDNPYAAPAGGPYAAPPGGPYAGATGVAPVARNSDADPGLAFILGLIPGVGAIYNGQYAKGLIHVVMFGFIVALQDHDGPLVVMNGFLIPAFIFYMAFEAMHTAKRRLEGLPVDEFSSIAPLGGRANGFPVGPVILMAAGVFLLLANLDLISVRAVLRWWPVGLIAVGAYMLYLRTLGASDESR